MSILIALLVLVIGYFIYPTFELKTEEWELTVPLLFVAGVLAFALGAFTGHMAVAYGALAIMGGQLIRIIHNSRK
jgi:hypothetical protein